MKARAFEIYAIAQKKNSFIDWYLLLIIIDNFYFFYWLFYWYPSYFLE